MRILFHKKFHKQYYKLSDQLKILIEEKTRIFCKNPYDAQLKTHKLHGKFYGFYSFSVNYEIRIVFELTERNTALFYLIGRHDIYD